MTLSQGTIVLVTGANQGIGFEVAKQLHAQYSDYKILLGARDADKGAKAATEIDPTGQSVVPITIDVTKDSSIEQAVKYVEEKYGALDVLINNAGINNDLGRQHQQTPRELRDLYREVYEVNVFGAVITTEAFIPLLEKSTSHPPRIVFVSSHTGSLELAANGTGGWERLRDPSFPAYRSTKAALNMWTVHFANRFGEKGWKVNASCPNLTATNFSNGLGRPASESARNIVRLATLKEGGENGTYSDENGVVPW